MKVDAEKIRNLLLGNTNSILESGQASSIKNLLWGSSDIISEGDQASSEEDLLTSQQSDLISDGAASLLLRITQQKK